MSSDFADVARALALKIAATATWSADRCNWLGAEPWPVARAHGGSASLAALGPDLYAGTSGVALFLAECARRLDADVGATALGAIRHALRHADPSIDGLYSGAPGIAWAATRVGDALDDDETRAGARRALGDWWRMRDPTPASCDLLAGVAGSLAGLVALSEAIDDPWIVDAAIALGEQLLARAERSDAGWSWPAARSRHNLCGFSHGAAGIGHALFELHALTGDIRALHAAEGAFMYERSWLAHRGESWPDLRNVDVRSDWDVPGDVADTWCNGAPGIALSRLRAAVGRKPERGDAETALAATRHAATSARDEPTDFSLCHGAAGVGDVLLCAGESALAADLGRLGIERHHDGGAPFPCGLRSGSTPCLMLGLAGIGMFYLRLVAPSAQSPLRIERERRG